MSGPPTTRSTNLVHLTGKGDWTKLTTNRPHKRKQVSECVPTDPDQSRKRQTVSNRLLARYIDVTERSCPLAGNRNDTSDKYSVGNTCGASPCGMASRKTSGQSHT